MSLHSSSTFTLSSGGLSKDIMSVSLADFKADEPKSLFQSAINIMDPSKETLMDRVLPNNSYQVNAQNITSMQRSGSKLVNDGGNVSGQTVSAKQDVKQQQARLKDDVQEMQKEAKVSSDPDNSVVASVMNKNVEASGAGSFVTSDKPSSITIGLSKSEQKLSVRDQEFALKDAQQQAESGFAFAMNNDANSGGKILKDDITPEDRSEILALDLDNLEEQMPEMAALKKAEIDLNLADNNHKSLDNQGNVNFDNAISIDSIDVELAGQGLLGISALKVDMSTYEMKFENVEDLSEKLGNDEFVYNPPITAFNQHLAIG